MPVDPRLPVAPWELDPRDRYATHWGSTSQESPETDPEQWRPPAEDTGLGVLRGMASWPADLLWPVTLPLDLGHAFAKRAGARFARDPDFPASAAVQRTLGRAAGQAQPLVSEATAPRDDWSLADWVRLANPAAWGQAANPLKAIRELARVPGTAARGLGRLAAEGIERGVQGTGPLAALRHTIAPMNVVRDPGGQFSPVELDRELGYLKPQGRTVDDLVREGFKQNYEFPESPGNIYPWAHPETGEIIIREEMDELNRKTAIDRWINTQLRRYVARDLGSPADPLLARARRGEPLHMTEEALNDALRDLPVRTANEAGMLQRKYDPSQGNFFGGDMPVWGGLADAALRPTRAGLEAVKAYPGRTREAALVKGIDLVDLEDTLPEQYKFLPRLPPDTPMWALRPNALNDLGFGHVYDVLMEDLATGRLRPESLTRMSVEQAVARTADYDAKLAKRMGEAAKKREAAMPVVKEYPVEGAERGWRWIELNKPGAFAEESDRMGHSVRGYEPPKGHGGTGANHPDWVPESGNSGSMNYGHGGWGGIKEGRARVLSLRGPDGKSYATVEIARVDPRPGTNAQLEDWMNAADISPKERMERMLQFHRWANENTGAKPKDWDVFGEFLKSIGYEPPPPKFRITQIKGPQNAAPAAEALPYVQDLVRNLGPWHGEIGNIRNTGLIDMGPFSGNWIKGLMTKDEAIAAIKALETNKEFLKGRPEPDASTGRIAQPAREDLSEWIRSIEHGLYGPGARRLYAAGGSVRAEPDLDDLLSTIREDDEFDELLKNLEVT